MTDSPFRGVIPPVVIPLTEKRQLDLEALERSINRMIDAGVDGLFFLGSSGEVAFLTDAQRYHVLQEAIAMVHGRVPVLTGIIDMETMRVVDQAKRATGYGGTPSWQPPPSRPRRSQRGGPPLPRHPRYTDLPFAYARLRARADPRCSCASARTALQGVKDSSRRRRSAGCACRTRTPATCQADRPRGVVDGLPGRCRRLGSGLANIDPASYVSRAPRKPATGSACARSRITSHASGARHARVGHRGLARAWRVQDTLQMGVSNTNDARARVLEGEDG
ncbi:MAG: dihydrodipicolinate synthase family protein [Eggerthellaceae bacterium]